MFHGPCGSSVYIFGSLTWSPASTRTHTDQTSGTESLLCPVVYKLDHLLILTCSYPGFQLKLFSTCYFSLSADAVTKLGWRNQDPDADMIPTGIFTPQPKQTPQQKVLRLEDKTNTLQA